MIHMTCQVIFIRYHKHVQIQKVLSEGSDSDNVFFFFFFFFFFCFFMGRGGGGLMVGERIHIPLKAGHYRPASEMPFKWRFADGPTIGRFVIIQGIWTSIALIFFTF